MRKPHFLRLLFFLLRFGLGCFFLFTGLSKITALHETALMLTRSDILPESLSMPLASIGVAMELVVGLCLVFRLSYRAATLWLSVMCSVFVLLFVQAWLRGLSLSCNCWGELAEVTNYPLEVCYRLLILGAAILLCWDAFRENRLQPAKKPLNFSDL